MRGTNRLLGVYRRAEAWGAAPEFRNSVGTRRHVDVGSPVLGAGCQGEMSARGPLALTIRLRFDI